MILNLVMFGLNSLLMLAFPILLAIFLTKRWKLGWRIFWIGAATFVGSQVFHIPFNWLVSRWLNTSDMLYWPLLAQSIFNAAFLGLSAGIFEETARYLVLSRWARDVRSWRKGILFGAGHGGVEAFILGALVLFSFIQLLVLRSATPDQLQQLVGASMVEQVQAQLASVWSLPWYSLLLGALERFLTIPVHIFLAVLVMQVVIRRQARWLFLAILYHTLLNGVLVFLRAYLSPYLLEGVLALFTIASLLLTFKLFKPEPVVENEPVLGQTPPVTLIPLDETNENLDNSRFQG